MNRSPEISRWSYFCALCLCWFATAEGQVRTVPDLREMDTTSWDSLPEEVRAGALSGLCKFLLDSPASVGEPANLLVINDTILTEVPNRAGRCHAQPLDARVLEINFVRSEPAMRIYGERARGGIVRVRLRDPMDAREPRYG